MRAMEMPQKVDLERVARREGCMSALGGLRHEPAAVPNEVGLPEASPGGNEGCVALAIRRAPIHDGEILVGKLRQAERVREQVVHERHP